MQRLRTPIAASIAAFAILSFVCAGDRASNGVVAMVGDVSVRLSDIRMTDEKVHARFANLYARDPSYSDMEELATIRFELEQAQLTRRIHAAIRSQVLSRLNIVVSDQEVERRWQEMIKGIDVPAKLTEGNETMEMILAGLDAVCDGGADPDDVYAERLKPRISEAQWKLHIEHDCAPKRRNTMRRVLAQGGAKESDYRPMVRDILIEEKASAAIGEELVRTDPEYAEFLRLAETDPENEWLRSKPPTYRDAKRIEWWDRQYNEAKVEIVDDRFKDAWPPKGKE